MSDDQERTHILKMSERVSALIFFLMSEIWVKLKKLVSVELVESIAAKFCEIWLV